MRCKKDDLAIVLDHTHDAYGWIVEVCGFIGDGWMITGDGADTWGSNQWEIKHPRLNEEDAPWGCSDEKLLPIRPDELKETEETEKELTV